MSFTNTIIYSDTLNETEFLRTLAKLGVKTLGVRVMDSYDLSLFILSKLGKTKKGVYLNNEEQDFIYYSQLNLQLPCFNDASNLRSAINSFRDTGNGNTYQDLDKYLNKSFTKKANTIKEAFENYTKYKQKNDCYDLYDLLYELDGNPVKIAANVIYFDEMPFSPLAIKIFSRYFDLTPNKFSLLVKPDNHQESIIKKCYGKTNELGYVLNTIVSKNLNLDTCLLVLTDPKDATGLINRFEQYGVPFSSSLGYPFGQTNVGKMVAKIRLMKSMAYGVDAYKGLFQSAYFEKNNYFLLLPSEKMEKDFIKYLGWLRPNFEDDPIIVDKTLYSSSMYNVLQQICDDISNIDGKYYEFIEKNTTSDKYNFEALSLLKKYLNYSKKYQISFDDIIDSLLSSTVSQHISLSGSVHVCSLMQAFSSLRDNIFIIGLDSSFPGNPKENYLIYDEEYIKMKTKQFTSSEVVKEKERLMNLLIAVSKQSYLSYSYYSVMDTKEVNPSSIIFRINNNVKKIEEFSYSDDHLSLNGALIKAYNGGSLSKTIIKKAIYQYNSTDLLAREYSPSSFGDFFNNKLAFILQNIFNVKVDEPDDPYLVISSQDRGNIFHDAVKGFYKKNLSEQELVDKGLKLFDKFIQSKPPIIYASMIRERNYFEKGLRNFYVSDPGFTCEKAEEPISNCLINGILFKGKFDRLEKNSSGQYILVDYKTGTTMHHKDDDPVSCVQGLLYAAMIEMQFPNIKISYCEFRYPFANDSAQIQYNATNKKALMDMIDQFKDAINNHDFSCLDEEYSYVEKYDHLISLVKELRR